MRINKLGKMLAACALVSACTLGALAFTGCSSESDELTIDSGLTGGVAATVNGEEISEDRVTRAINSIRINYGYTDDDNWKTFFTMYGYTVESMRYNVLGGFVDEALVKQCADQLGLSVTDEEIDEAVNSVSSQYSSQEAWEDAVSKVGYENGVDGYRESLKYSILQQKINDIYQDEAEKDMKKKKNILSAINESISTYDGAKKTSMVIFAAENENQAKVIRKKIADGEITIEDAAKDYSIDASTKDKGGDMGWDKLNTYNEEYTNILNDLEKEGEVSKAIETENGWVVVQLKEVYNAPKKVTSTSSVPEDFVTEIKTNAISDNASDKYDEWLDSVREQQDVVVNPMPANVPYWIDLSGEYSEEEIKEKNDEAYAAIVGEVAEEEAVDEAVEENNESNSSEANADEGAEETAGEQQESEGSDNAEADSADLEADEADSGE